MASNSEYYPSGNSTIQSTHSTGENREDKEQIFTSTSDQSLEDYATNGPSLQSTSRYFLELSLLLSTFSASLTTVVFQNQLIYQQCILKYNESTCILLAKKHIPDEFVNLNRELEKYVAKILSVCTVLQCIIPMCMSLLIGPWSDRFGRKPLLLSSLTGFFLGFSILCAISIVSLHFKVSPWFYTIPYLPIALLGGNTGFMTGVYSYVNDISSNENRSHRMIRMEAATLIGFFLGVLSYGPLFELTSASFVFGCSGLCTLFSLISVYLFVNESIKNETEETGCMAKFKALFQWKHVMDTFQACFKRGERYNRILMWLVMIVLFLTWFAKDGSDAFNYLFMREKFNLIITDYEGYSTFNYICQIIGSILGMYILRKFFGISDILLVIIGFISGTAEFIAIGLIDHFWELYVVCMLAMLKVISVPILRSHFASMLPATDVGKMFSIVTSMQLLAPTSASPIYTFIFNCTIETYPGAVYFFSAIIFIFCTLLITVVFIMSSRRQEVSNYVQHTS